MARPEAGGFHVGQFVKVSSSGYLFLIIMVVPAGNIVVLFSLFACVPLPMALIDTLSFQVFWGLYAVLPNGPMVSNKRSIAISPELSDMSYAEIENASIVSKA